LPLFTSVFNVDGGPEIAMLLAEAALTQAWLALGIPCSVLARCGDPNFS